MLSFNYFASTRFTRLKTLLALAALLPGIGSATVAYRLKPEVSAGTLLVSIKIDHPQASESFEIPGWSPGYYLMEKYETKVGDVKATDGTGKALTIKHDDPRTWQVACHPNSPVTLTYRVIANDVGLGFFGATVNATEAYTNGPASFMYVIGRRDEPTSLHVDVPGKWKLATTMTSAGPDMFSAPNYDEMVDNPIQMGVFEEREFKVRGIPFRAVFVTLPGEIDRWKIDAQTAVLKQVSEPAVDLFQGAPFKQYTYFFHLTGLGFQGGLEHHAGTVIAVPNSDDIDLSDLAAHEFFHAWNVKQIRPIVLGPFDYTTPQRTGNLWFAEGVTDYYSKVLTYRSGAHDLGWLLGELNEQINQYQSGTVRLKSTVEDSSRAAWEHEGFGMGDLDFYNKGLLSGLIFDAKIRAVTDGKKSLDDVMRLMYKKYRYPNPGYPEDGIKAAINEVAGTDLSSLYDSLIRSTDELPYAELKAIGLEVAAPNATFAIACGYPTPTEHASIVDLNRLGVQEGDKFLGFAPSTTSGSSQANFKRGDWVKLVSIPLSDKVATGWQIFVDPTPNQAEADRFREWINWK